jgi:predicted phosphoribosyltransferase
LSFADRIDAGEKLGEALLQYSTEDTIVLGIPRGGVIIGYEVADKIQAPLDIIVPKKLGAPHNPELAIGAVTEEGEVVLDEDLVNRLGVAEDYIRGEAERKKEEIQRRLEEYRGEAPYPRLEGRVVILVDDGIATGSTMRAAILSVKSRNPERLVVGVPVASAQSVEELKPLVDDMVVLSTPRPFYAIGQFYQSFQQNTDEQVMGLLRRNREEVKGFSVNL